MSLFISVDSSGAIIVHGGSPTEGFIVTMYPDEAMSLVTSLLDASKASGSILTPHEPIWGTQDNRFFNEEHSDSVEAEIIVYSNS